MSGGCYHGSDWSGADFDIANIGTTKTYKDKCYNVINIEKNDGKPTPGYKEYIHSATGRARYLAGIKYGDSDQKGFPGVYEYYGPQIAVYCLDYDAFNLVPLMVRLNHTTDEYYIRDNYLTVPKEWKRDRTISEDDLSKELGNTIKELNNLVVLRLDKMYGHYYANGTDTAPKFNSQVTITVSSSGSYTTYKRYNHIPSGGKMRLISTKSGDKNLPFSANDIYTREYENAYVYFWSEDTSHTPLLIELYSGHTHTYLALNKDGKWEVDSSAWSNLEGTLDLQNCLRNGAHIMDVSKTRGPSYPCLTKGCTHKSRNISLETTKVDGYKKSVHTVSGGCIRKFMLRETMQRGLPSLQSTTKVIVFHYPLRKGSPILMHIPSIRGNSWYQRYPYTENWEAVHDDTQLDENNPTEIKAILKTINPHADVNESTPDISPGEHASEARPTKPSKGESEEEVENKIYSSKRIHLHQSGKAIPSHVGIIAAVVTVGVCLAAVFTYEGFMLHRNPRMSLTVLLMRKFKRPSSDEYLL